MEQLMDKPQQAEQTPETAGQSQIEYDAYFAGWHRGRAALLREIRQLAEREG